MTTLIIPFKVSDPRTDDVQCPHCIREPPPVDANVGISEVMNDSRTSNYDMDL